MLAGTKTPANHHNYKQFKDRSFFTLLQEREYINFTFSEDERTVANYCSKDFFLYFHVFCHGGELSYYRGCVAKF